MLALAESGRIVVLKQRSIFSSRSFRQYFIGQSLSLFGDGFRTLAIPLLVFKLTHSALSTGVSYACEFLPFALFSVVAGSLADRLSRRTLMLGADAVRCAIMLLFAALFVLHRLSLTEIYAGLVLVSLAAAVFLGGQSPSIPFLLGKERGTEATAVLSGAENFANLVTPVIGGTLFAFFGPVPALAITAGGYFCSLLSLARIPSLGPEAISGVPSLRETASDTRTGFRMLFADRGMRAQAFVSLGLNVLGMGGFAVIIPFLNQDFGAGDRGVGIFLGIMAAGSICGSVAAVRFARRWRFGYALTIAYLVDAFAFLPVVLGHSFWLAAICWGISSGCVQFEVAQIVGFRLRVTPEQYLGRVLGAVRLFVVAGISPAIVAFGWLADRFGAHAAMWLSAAGYLAVAVVACISPAIRDEAR